MTPEDRRRGCLLGGAIGDAVGAPLEFLRLDEIEMPTGPLAFTDDTQMTVFTAEGLIRALVRFLERGIVHAPSVVWRAYRRWLVTQGVDVEDTPDGWLVSERVLHERRAPGATCLAALRGGEMGTMEEPVNSSKGCGGVMRVAPAGLIGANDPFSLGCELAALTHGHPSGYLAGGAFAVMIASLVEGASMPAAVQAGLVATRGAPESDEVVAALERAVSAAGREPVTPGTIEWLGGGWVAEEALAISVFCALTAKDFRSGVLAAVTHSGDSDSTGAMTGNLLGALLGVEGLPRDWLERLRGREVVEQVALDLGVVQTFSSSNPGLSSGPPAEFVARYPGW